MAYGSVLADTVQSSTAGTAPTFKDGNGTETGTLCRAWVNLNGTNGSVRASFNVSSVVKNSTGTYTITFTNALSDANYAVTGTGSYANVMFAYADSTYTPTTTSVKISIYTSSGSAYDGNAVSVAIFR